MSMVLALILSCVLTEAALPPPQAAIGGIAAANEGFSLKNISLLKIKNSERLVVDLADVQGLDVKGTPTYYHAEVKRGGKQIILDLSQTGTTFIDEKLIANQLKSSQLISKVNLLLDPTDKTMSVLIELKKPVQAKFYQVPGKKQTSRIVVDLFVKK